MIQSIYDLIHSVNSIKYLYIVTSCVEIKRIWETREIEWYFISVPV